MGQSSKLNAVQRSNEDRFELDLEKIEPIW